jgi:hypothetical protein
MTPIRRATNHASDKIAAGYRLIDADGLRQRTFR